MRILISSPVRLLVVATLGLLLLPDVVLAQAIGNSPAQPAPAERWAEATGSQFSPYAIAGDTTHYRFNYEPDCDEPFWHDIVARGPYLFTVTGSSFQVWDTENNPSLQQGFFGNGGATGESCKPVLGIWRKTDTDFYLLQVAALPGDTDLAGVGSKGGMGFIAIDTSIPTSPKTVYQDEWIAEAKDLVGTSIDGHDYFFALSNKDIHVYDAEQIRAVAAAGATCYETPPGARNCFRDVHKGLVVDTQGAKVKSIARIAARGRYLITQSATAGISVWDLTGLPNGQGAVLVATGGPFGSQLEAWKKDGVLYFATATGGNAEIWRTECSSSCSNVRVTTLPTPSATAANGQNIPTDTLRWSKDNGKHYLWVGSTDGRGETTEKEWLFDVSDPEQPQSVSSGNHPDGYWGWYYYENPTGFRNNTPRYGVVVDEKLFRAAWSILDVHSLNGLSPVAGISVVGGTTVFGGTIAQLNDSSTGGATSYAWDADNDGTWDTTTKNLSLVIPTQSSYPKHKIVRHQACNEMGCSTAQVTLVIEDPRPQIISTSAQTCSTR